MGHRDYRMTFVSPVGENLLLLETLDGARLVYDMNDPSFGLVRMYDAGRLIWDYCQDEGWSNKRSS